MSIRNEERPHLARSAGLRARRGFQHCREITAMTEHRPPEWQASSRANDSDDTTPVTPILASLLDLMPLRSPETCSILNHTNAT